MVVGGFVALMVGTCRKNQDVHEAGEAFLGELRAGKIQDAYARLSSERKSAMSLAEFNAFSDHRALRQHGSARLGKVVQHSRGRCTNGSLDVGGQSWALELYYLEEAGTWRVHSIALQPPAPVALAHLLPECGYWAGTRSGYSGPDIERSTRATH